MVFSWLLTLCMRILRSRRASSEFLWKLCFCLSVNTNAWFSCATLGWRNRRKWPSSLCQKPQLTWGGDIFLLDRKTFWYKLDSAARCSPSSVTPCCAHISVLTGGSCSPGEQQWLKEMHCKIHYNRFARLPTTGPKAILLPYRTWLVVLYAPVKRKNWLMVDQITISAMSFLYQEATTKIGLFH